MKKEKKKIVIGIMLVLTIVSVGLLSGCIQATGKHMFLDCSVSVEWKNHNDGTQRCFISFYKSGNYTFTFDPDKFPVEYHNDCCSCCEYKYCVTETMIKCCGYEINLRPDGRLEKVRVTVSNGEASECYWFTG